MRQALVRRALAAAQHAPRCSSSARAVATQATAAAPPRLQQQPQQQQQQQQDQQHEVLQVLVLPYYRRYWLLHAWRDDSDHGGSSSSGAAAAHEQQQQQQHPPWTEGADAQEKLRLLFGSLQRWGSHKVEQQWNNLAQAAPGTLNARLYSLARTVLSRTDPNELFLKAVPGGRLRVLHPASLPPTLVRRQLRLLARRGVEFHASRMRLWAAAMLPQVPLIPLPLPNVTIYYTVWRVVSNYSARKGAVALRASLDLASDLQRLRLARQLQEAVQQRGVALAPGSWAAQLVADADGLQQRLQRAGLLEQQAGAAAAAGGGATLLPVFVPDAQLDALCGPFADRWGSRAQRLPEDAIAALVERFKQPHLWDHYRAAANKCPP